ncbi:LysR substrate-binding domain-containing protein [Lentzea flava]|uniref:LysR substrate-binding domain-containing protein n=1 Tax=Lentzea flava TaxID=103732 RepID=UPI0026463708|nr:LysR substrate-binding domain-containing protein [Lentzea flava]
MTSRPPHRSPDAEAPRLHVTPVQDAELRVAASATGTFPRRTSLHVDELVDAPWIATSSSTSEPPLDVWPGLSGRAHIVHSARDWLTKLYLAVGGFGITTIAERLSPVLPSGVIPLRVKGAAPEIRRVLVAGSPVQPHHRPRRSRRRSPQLFSRNDRQATAHINGRRPGRDAHRQDQSDARA